jgi:hypothetical protein
VALSAPRRSEVSALLVGLGAEARPHTGRTFLAHSLAVGDILDAWGCRESVCLAGICHSIYGTEISKAAALPLDRRDDLRARIGEEAERLAYLNCAVDRRSLDLALLSSEPPFRVRDRWARALCVLGPQEFDDLLHVHLADWLEQVPHSGIGGYRPEAQARIAERLGGPPLASFRQTITLAPPRE